MLEANTEAFVALLLISATVAVIIKRVPVPYVVALAVVGCAGGVVFGAGRIILTPSLILFILLPGLLFEAAFNLQWPRLRSGAIQILALATIGVLVTTAVAGLLGHLLLGLSLGGAVVFGAVLAPTDPVAVVAVFRRLGLPSRLVTIVEAESLVNDGTAVVLFSIALSAATGETTNAPSVLLESLRLVGGGVAIGLAIGLALSWVTVHIDDPQIEITITAVCAYGTYLVAERAQVSAILAVVAAAATMGNYGRTHGMSPRTAAAVDVFWDYLAFLLNSATFLLIGFAVPWQDLTSNLGAIAAAFAILMLGRAVAVYAVLGALRPFGQHLLMRWQHLLVWSGLRGAVAIALLLSLTDRGGEFDTIRSIAYGVVLLSILIQGSTVGTVSHWLLPTGQASRRAGESPS
ncbi:MAG TPA: sodium:proton antiporter [Candidatus Saccharimonadales bacterium]|nr:sodium:proton antiporter [Candidatus Saccharimonadales bacterium]